MRITLSGVMRFHLAALMLASFCLCAGRTMVGETPETFKFTKIDLELLEKVNQVDREFERRGLVFNDPDTIAYIGEVGMKMVPEGPFENVAWRFRVLRDPEPNAFALPNGSIYLNTGLLAMLRSEAQLASVLGHEVTHVIKRHVYLENRSNRKKTATINILSAMGGLAGNVSGWSGVVIAGVLSRAIPGVMVVTIYGYSRELERDADSYGLRAMAQNNYPPIQMAATFEQLKSGHEVQLEKEARGLYTDHPRLDDRIKYVSEMVDSLPLSGTPIVRAAEYSREMRQVMRHDVTLEILSGRARTALGVAIRLTDMYPESSEDAFLLGEAYRALGGHTARPRSEELTDSAKSATRKQLGRMTPLEYESALRATREGKAAWSENVTAAESAYRHALTLDPHNARAIRGLAALCDQDARTAEAIDGYRKYLELAPMATDVYQIKKRTEELEKVSTASAAGNTNNN